MISYPCSNSRRRTWKHHTCSRYYLDCSYDSLFLLGKLENRLIAQKLDAAHAQVTQLEKVNFTAFNSFCISSMINISFFSVTSRQGSPSSVLRLCYASHSHSRAASAAADCPHFCYVTVQACVLRCPPSQVCPRSPVVRAQPHRSVLYISQDFSCHW